MVNLKALNLGENPILDQDLVIVVNGDDVVNIQDLVMVANAFE